MIYIDIILILEWSVYNGQYQTLNRNVGEIHTFSFMFCLTKTNLEVGLMYLLLLHDVGA